MNRNQRRHLRSGLLRLLVVGVALLGAAWAVQAAAADDAPFLWQVQGSKSTHFLLGSVHLQPRSGTRLPPPIIQAYRQSQAVVFETDIDALHSTAVQQQFAKKGRATSGGLRREVGEPLYTQTVTALRKLGMPGTFCDQIRGWLCGMSIEIYQWRRDGFEGAQGIDELIYAAAKHDHRVATWLETPETQINLFADMPDALVHDFLSATIEDDNNPLESPRALYRAWRENDVQAIANLAEDMHKHYPDLYQRLLVSRNRAWSPQLEALFAKDTSQLVVVGAAHCVGPDGLVATLQAKGYVVTPVKTLAPLEAASLDPARTVAQLP